MIAQRFRIYWKELLKGKVFWYEGPEREITFVGTANGAFRKMQEIQKTHSTKGVSMTCLDKPKEPTDGV